MYKPHLGREPSTGLSGRREFRPLLHCSVRPTTTVVTPGGNIPSSPFLRGTCSRVFCRISHLLFFTLWATGRNQETRARSDRIAYLSTVITSRASMTTPIRPALGREVQTGGKVRVEVKWALNIRALRGSSTSESTSNCEFIPSYLHPFMP